VSPPTACSATKVVGSSSKVSASQMRSGRERLVILLPGADALLVEPLQDLRGAESRVACSWSRASATRGSRPVDGRFFGREAHGGRGVVTCRK